MAGPGRGHSRATTRPTTTAGPNARLSSVDERVVALHPVAAAHAAGTRLTTSSSGRGGNRASTTSPSRTRPASRTRRTSNRSPEVTVGDIEGPLTRARTQALDQWGNPLVTRTVLVATAGRVADDRIPRAPGGISMRLTRLFSP